ncbi:MULTISPECIES: MerR family transcriptional regulator [unclassified Nocardiopsis]|uniref:MerR family transcriptional regulator n=1 Tax=unclassified Nocardiopsis TaxID=2649073 RepID=UPI001F484D83|nr:MULTISPECIES: MerR family transcriptional regulator [unclassified Nocardiopsis]
MAELSERSGIPVPTIKYYLREGVLPRGERTGRSQARYGVEHLRRLRLVRALTDVGGLSIAAVREILASVDSPEPTAHELLGRTLEDVTPLTRRFGDADESDAERAAELVGRRAWCVPNEQRALTDLAEVLSAFRRVGHPVDEAMLDGYAAAVERIARVDLDFVGGVTETDEILERAVVGTVLGDALLAVLRRLAQTGESARRSGASADGR